MSRSPAPRLGAPGSWLPAPEDLLAWFLTALGVPVVWLSLTLTALVVLGWVSLVRTGYARAQAALFGCLMANAVMLTSLDTDLDDVVSRMRRTGS